MSDSNKLQVTYVAESTWGEVPASPATKKIRLKGESLKDEIQNIRSEEIRDDRLTPDLVQVSAKASGGINGEISWGAHDDLIEGAFLNTWQNMPVKLNATSDSSITQVTDSTDTFTVDAGGASFVAGHLIRTSGFTNSANSGLFRVSSSTGTTIVVGGTPTLTDEAAPPAGAKIKVVGFRGASGDITATANGLGSTSLDFTTLGLKVGQFIKIGGSTSGEKFATAALNDWVRITAIGANAITCDNLPSGWTTDSGSSKTITVYAGDIIRNNKANYVKRSFSIEKVILSQAVPAYVVYKGMTVNQMTISAEPSAILACSFDFVGKTAAISTTSIDSTPDEAATNDVMNAVGDFGRIAEAGSSISSPNYPSKVSINLSNNLRDQMALGVMGNVDVGIGDSVVTGEIEAYFGDKTLYDKFKAGTATNLNFRVQKDSKAIVVTIPRMKFEDLDVAAGARNQDVMQSFRFTALRDSTTLCSLQIDRFEEFA